MQLELGRLLLLPAPLGENSLHTIPEYAINAMHQLKYFIAERAKTTRHFLKATQLPIPIQELNITELNKRTDPSEIPLLLAPALEGHDIGLLSEAGCPAVADPGAKLVGTAHKKGIEVVPFVGPSSILLALMASGLNGQQFCFNGYLSPKRPLLAKDLKRLETKSQKNGQTQIFMETPYRNNALLEEATKALNTSTLFCVAADITLPTQFIKTQTIEQWRKKPLPDLHKRPAIFLLY